MTSKTTANPYFLFFPDWATLEVVGPDAGSWLNAIATGEIASVGGVKGCWSSLLTKQGKVQADLQIVGDQEHLVMAVSGGDASDVLSTLDGYLIMEDAEIEQSELSWVVAVGPTSRDLLTEAGVNAFELPWGSEAVFAASLSADELAALQERAADQVASRGEWLGWLIAHGVPRMGVEYSAQDNLHAASLERRTVDWSKGCYLGQEVVCMQDMRGKVKKRLVRLSAQAPIPESGALRVPGTDEPIGEVLSSADFSAIASVKAPHFESETTLVLGDLNVTVHELRA